MLILIRINERFNWNLRIETIRHVDALLCDYSKYEKNTNVKNGYGGCDVLGPNFVLICLRSVGILN